MSAEWLDADGYPTEAALERIKTWDVLADPLGVLLFAADLWYYPDRVEITVGKHGFLKNRNVIRAYFSTGGWSGNESVIEELIGPPSNFGVFFLDKWERGGHWWFEISKDYNDSTKAFKEGK